MKTLSTAAALLLCLVSPIWNLSGTVRVASAQETDSRLLPIVQPGPATGQVDPAAILTPEPQAEPSAPLAVLPTDHEPLYTNHRMVDVPLGDELLTALTGESGLAEAVVLYVSGNQGRSWVRAQKRALPSETAQFVAANDGTFWCIVHAETVRARGEPPAPGAEPQRIVVVDSEPPVIHRLSAGVPDGEGNVDVTWQAEDTSPLVAAKAVALHNAGQEVARPAEVTGAETGRVRFRLTEPGLWHIGVQLADAAGNTATARCTTTFEPSPKEPVAESAPPAVQPSEDVAESLPEPAAPSPGEELEPAAEVRAREETAILNTRTLRIGYRWDQEHPPTRVGLWVSRDGGRSWRLDQVDTERTGSFLFLAAEDGVYGFRTHRELGDRTWNAPQSGVAPEREVIIDTTPPQVTWLAPLAGDPAGESPAPAVATSPVSLKWSTVEAFPADEPIVLEYRLFAEEIWRPMAGPMADLGTYEWTVPLGVTGTVEVRLTARDRVGRASAACLSVEIIGSAAAAETAAAPVDPAARDEARRAYAMATVARLQENWEAAEKQLLRATSLDPTLQAGWVDLGGIYLHTERWQSAADVYRKAVELRPDNVNASFGLAKALFAQGDLKGAAGTLDGLLARAPENADAWRTYGDVLYRDGDLDRARQCWLKALALGGGQQANLAAIQRRLQLKR